MPHRNHLYPRFMYRSMHPSGRSVRRTGFSLIEHIITVVIVAVLAAIAIPAYAGYVARARRADARAQLMQTGQFMQRFYVANDTYLQDRAGNTVFSQVPATLKQSPADSKKLYDLAIPAATLTAFAFEVRMVPVSGGVMADDSCGILVLSSTGVRSVVVGGVTDNGTLRDTCWK